MAESANDSIGSWPYSSGHSVKLHFFKILASSWGFANFFLFFLFEDQLMIKVGRVEVKFALNATS